MCITVHNKKPIGIQDSLFPDKSKRKIILRTNKNVTKRCAQEKYKDSKVYRFPSTFNRNKTNE